GAYDDVDDRTGEHRADNSNGKVASGILRLLGGGRDRVETVESEEHDRRRRHDPVRPPHGPGVAKKPCGANGCRLEAWKCGSATTTKSDSVASFKITRTMLTRALSRVPKLKSAATTPMIRTAST